MEGAEDPYKEIRVENILQDKWGNEVALKKGAQVDVTIEAGPEEQSPRNSRRQQNPLNDLVTKGYTNLCILTPFAGRDNLAMASWAFTCKYCQWVFTYSKIGETLADSIAEEKLKLPPEGVECICPHCKVKGKYHRYELIYRNSSLGRSTLLGLGLKTRPEQRVTRPASVSVVFLYDQREPKT